MDPDLLRTAAEALSIADRGRFLELCEARDAESLRADAVRIRDHLGMIELMAADDSLVDLKLARQVGAALLELILRAGSLSFEQRRLLAGAIEYFIQPSDASNDYRALAGLEDDARITRAVCNALGQPELANGW